MPGPGTVLRRLFGRGVDSNAKDNFCSEKLLSQSVLSRWINSWEVFAHVRALKPGKKLLSWMYGFLGEK